MGLVVVYGAIDFLLPKKTVNRLNDQVTVEEVKKFMSDVIEQVNKTNLSPKDQYVIDLSLRRWEKDPFVKDANLFKLEEKKSDGSVEAIHIRYTGYLQIADKMIAVINGSEYEVGQPIDPYGYTVIRITKQNVVIIVEEGVERIIPIEEML